VWNWMTRTGMAERRVNIMTRDATVIEAAAEPAGPSRDKGHDAEDDIAGA